MQSKLNNIQGLRAYAAVSVAYFHTGYVIPHVSPFGFYGVDVFFVISGFIMAGICDLRPQKFFKRRVIRIVPMYWLVTFGMFILALLVPSLLKATHANLVELVKSLLFIPFFKEDGLLQPLLFVGWSLNYEMYFYVLLALVLLVVPGKRTPLVTCALLVLVPSVLHPWHDRNALTKFYGDMRPFEFIVGIACYYVARAVPVGVARKLRWPLIGCMLLAVAELAVYFMLPLPYFPPDWIGFGTPAAVLVLSAALLAKCGADLRARWLILLGDASYAIYLLHPFVLYAMERVLAKRWPVLSSEHNFFGMVLGVAAVCAASCVVYLYIEKPLVDWLAARFAQTRRPPLTDPAEMPL